MTFKDLTPTSVTLPTGVELNYVRGGPASPDKPTVILVHGAMGDWRAWAPQWEDFTKTYDTITYSRRYSFPNKNDMPSPDHGAFVEAEDLIGFMDLLGIEKAILVGSSYGTFISLAVAAQVPERVIALAGAEPPMMKYAQMYEEGAKIAAEFREAAVLPSRAAFEAGEDEKGAHLLTAGIGGKSRRKKPPSPEAIRNRFQNIKAAKMLALSSDEFPLIEPEVLAGLEMPIYLMRGANTAPVHAAIFEGITRVMTQAKTKIVDGSGHSISREQSEVFNSEILSFFEKELEES